MTTPGCATGPVICWGRGHGRRQRGGASKEAGKGNGARRRRGKQTYWAVTRAVVPTGWQSEVPFLSLHQIICSSQNIFLLSRLLLLLPRMTHFHLETPPSPTFPYCHNSDFDFGLICLCIFTQTTFWTLVPLAVQIWTDKLFVSHKRPLSP